MRIIYSFSLYFIAPLLPLYLKKRGKKNTDYLKNWHERFGFNLVNLTTKPIIWLHSVSVGETRAMQKLVELIGVNFPNYQILITTMTPTGRATAINLYPEALIHYIPYDLSFCVKRFYNNFKPYLGIILETEIWPNLIHFAAKYQIPLYLVNARLSDNSYQGYKRFNYILRPILNKFKAILCQDNKTAANFKKLNYSGKLEVVGNTKFDLLIPANIKNKILEFNKLFNNTKRIVMFASTRDGEEEIILDNIILNPDILYLFVPRHPERFAVLERLLTDKNIIYQKRSENKPINNTTKVVIGDSLGEMLAYYAISTLAVIGGSFKGYGGQNPIEAIFMRLPVIFGSSMYNFEEVAQNSVNYGCAINIGSVNELENTISRVMNDANEYDKLRANCDRFIDNYQGASQKIFDIIAENIYTRNS